MKKILVPIDFSEVSHNAYLFARELAAIWKASIDLVYVYSGSYSPTEPVTVFSSNKTRKDVLMDRMNFFANELPEKSEKNPSVITAVQVDCLPTFGISTANTICKMSDDYNIIVMGTSGEKDVINKFLGSVSSSVAQKAYCPVLLIPPIEQFKGFDRIVFASNWESAEPRIIKDVSKWATAFESRVDFVHVNEKYELESFEKTEERIYDALFDNEPCAFSFNMLSVEEKTPLQGISDYALKNEADLVVLVNSQRGFISNILGQSMTKQMTMRPVAPILVYHYRDKDAFTYLV